MSDSKTTPVVGFIGLGIMGKPMAKNLLVAGFPVVVANRPAAAAAELKALGARVFETAGEVAQASDVIVTMLPDSPDVEKVVLGPGGVRDNARPGTIAIDMSTISPEVAQRVASELKAKGVAALDAPVSGGEQGAIDATLSIMVGGPQDTFDAAAPVFAALGKNIVRIGESGAGQTTKACNQILVAITIEGVAEALRLAEAAGVDGAKVRQALLGGLAQSKVLDVHGSRMLEKRFTPGFKAKLHLKDLRIAEATAAALHLELPATHVAFEQMSELASRDGETDHSALITLLA
jgi:2-hydroxy-3-oxopropionate reductase